MNNDVVLLINSLGTGGAERAVTAAARQLKTLGRSVRILCIECAPEETPVPPGIQIHYLSRLGAHSTTFLKLAALPFLACRLSRYTSRYRIPVVMSHLFRSNFVNVLSRVLARSRHRVVLVNHTRISRLSREGLQGRINWLLCRALYPRADLVASVSWAAATECATLLGLPAGRSIGLYDPIETPTSETVVPFALRSRVIVGVGRLVALKRYSDLIEAFTRVAVDFPDVELRIVGDGPEREKLERQAAETLVRDRIHFSGRIVTPLEELKGCSVFVSTSETEGFGMAIVEALAAGVPVISYDCAYGPREILSPATDAMQLLDGGSDIEVAPYGILCPVRSVSALAKALRLILGDESLAENLARKGLLRARDFSIERSTAAYEKILYQE